MKAYPNIDIRYFFEFTTDCPGDSLDFDNSTTWCLQEQGRSDAQKAMQIGQENIHRSIEEWENTPEIKKEYPYFVDYL